MKFPLAIAILASLLLLDGWAVPLDGEVSRPALEQLKSLRRILRADPVATVTGLECAACKVIFTVLQDLFLKNATEDEIVAVITAFCIDLKIEDENVCTAVVLEFKVCSSFTIPLLFVQGFTASNHYMHTMLATSLMLYIRGKRSYLACQRANCTCMQCNDHFLLSHRMKC